MVLECLYHRQFGQGPYNKVGELKHIQPGVAMKTLPLVLFVLSSLSCYSSVNYVQTKSAASNTVSSLSTGNFGSAVTASNIIVVFTSNTGTALTLSSCTDTLGNNFTIDVGPITQGTAIRAYMAHAYNIVGGTDAVTCTWSGSGNIAVTAAEYTGALTASDPLDVSASATGNATSWSCGTTAAKTAFN